VRYLASKSRVTLKTRLGFFQGHWTPFDRSHAGSYSPSILSMALSCIDCEI